MTDAKPTDGCGDGLAGDNLGIGVTKRLSIDEYLSDEAPPGFRDEQIEGEIVLSPDPKPVHADVANQLEAS
jgi:hypothetical protein